MKKLLLAVVAFAAISLPAMGAGLFPGLPAATPPLTGNETIPADTNLGSGINPATELVTPGMIAAQAGRNAAGKYSNVPIGSVAYGSLGTNTTPVSGTIYWTSIQIPLDGTASAIACMNGGTAATDKLLYGLYNNSGALVANTATAGTTATGTDAFQELALTANYSITSGQYWVAWQTNGTTTRFRTVAASTYIGVLSTSTTGTFGTLTTLTVPSTFTADKAPICYVKIS